MTNRATGRTTRILHQVIGQLLDQKSEIILVAYSMHYCLSLQQIIGDVLHAYCCYDFFQHKKGEIRNDRCRLRFMSDEKFNAPDRKPLEGEVVFFDHYFKGGES